MLCGIKTPFSLKGKGRKCTGGFFMLLYNSAGHGCMITCACAIRNLPQAGYHWKIYLGLKRVRSMHHQGFFCRLHFATTFVTFSFVLLARFIYWSSSSWTPSGTFSWNIGGWSQGPISTSTILITPTDTSDTLTVHLIPTLVSESPLRPLRRVLSGPSKLHLPNLTTFQGRTPSETWKDCFWIWDTSWICSFTSRNMWTWMFRQKSWKPTTSNHRTG